MLARWNPRAGLSRLRVDVQRFTRPPFLPKEQRKRVKQIRRMWLVGDRDAQLPFLRCRVGLYLRNLFDGIWRMHRSRFPHRFRGLCVEPGGCARHHANEQRCCPGEAEDLTGAFHTAARALPCAAGAEACQNREDSEPCGSATRIILPPRVSAPKKGTKTPAIAPRFESSIWNRVASVGVGARASQLVIRGQL